MKKNLIFIVIDSFANKNIDAAEIDCMPFLTELKKKSIYYPNMYSQAPYTEAAMISMLCGVDTMHNGGYFYRFRDNLTIMDYFHENEYNVVNYLQPHVFVSSIIRGANYPYYNVCYDFHVLWSYRLEYYQKKYEQDNLDELDKIKIIELLDENFEQWMRFFYLFLNRDESLSLIQRNLENSYSLAQIEAELNKVKKEHNFYLKNKKKYIMELFEKGIDHNLFSIIVMNQTFKISHETKQWINKEYNELFLKFYKINKKMNKKVCKLKITKIFDLLSDMLKRRNKEAVKSFIKYFKYYKDSYRDDDLMDRISKDLDNFKSAPSVHSHLEHFKKWELKHGDEKPYMAYIHVDDIHNPEVFFTYDTEDYKIIKDDLKLAETIANKIPKSATGSLTYYLSLAYIDLKISKFVEYLEVTGKMENTEIIITGDHGFSFDNIILRNSRVNNFYLENYQVPFILYNKSYPAMKNDSLCSSKDILVTICSSFSLITHDTSTGINLLHDFKSDIISMEYSGGGCPDIYGRDVIVAARSKIWMIVAKAGYEHKFKDIQILEVYNLKMDPHQLKNLYKKNIQQEDFKNILTFLTEHYQSMYENIRKKV